MSVIHAQAGTSAGQLVLPAPLEALQTASVYMAGPAAMSRRWLVDIRAFSSAVESLRDSENAGYPRI